MNETFMYVFLLQFFTNKIVLSINRCLSISALRNICHYITDHEYIQRLLELEMALSQCVKYPVKLTMNIVLETLYSALMKIGKLFESMIFVPNC